MELRLGTPSDLSFIYRLEKRYIEDLESDQLIAWQKAVDRHLDQWVANLARTTIAHAQGAPIGFSFWEHEAEKAVLASINVELSHRRKGVASVLLRKFENDARAAGCLVVELGFVSNNPARHLYEKFGYTSRGTEGRYVLMRKSL
jgi:GNAT superfamily N-acetyltransferase